MYNNIPEVLKSRRKSLGLTIKEVTSKLASQGFPISEKTLYGWEAGRRQPDSDAFLALCKIYEINTFDAFEAGQSSPDNLTPRETALIDAFRKLNEQGQNYLLQTAHMALQTYPAGDNSISNLENVG